MRKQDLILSVKGKMEAAGVSMSKKDLELVVDTMFSTFEELLLKEETVKLGEIGSIKTVLRKEKRGVNPQKPTEKVVYPASYSLKLVLGNKMKVALKKKPVKKKK